MDTVPRRRAATITPEDVDAAIRRFEDFTSVHDNDPGRSAVEAFAKYVGVEITALHRLYGWRQGAPMHTRYAAACVVCGALLGAIALRTALERSL